MGYEEQFHSVNDYYTHKKINGKYPRPCGRQMSWAVFSCHRSLGEYLAGMRVLALTDRMEMVLVSRILSNAFRQISKLPGNGI